MVISGVLQLMYVGFLAGIIAIPIGNWYERHKKEKETKKLIGMMVEGYIKYSIAGNILKEMSKDNDFRKVTRKYLGWKWSKKKSKKSGK